MTFRSVGTVFVIAICLSANNDVLGATTFDTTPSWNGSTIGAFGKGYTTTYGQTFIAPADSRLDDFTFYLRGNVSVHLSMKAYVFSWTGSLLGGGGGQATGNPLYVSPGSVVLDGNNTYQPITVNTGGTLLAPGQQYVALLTLSNPSDFDVSIGATVWNNRSSHVPNNGGGGFVYFNNASDIGALNTKGVGPFRRLRRSGLDGAFWRRPGAQQLCVGGYGRDGCSSRRLAAAGQAPLTRFFQLGNQKFAIHAFEGKF